MRIKVIAGICLFLCLTALPKNGIAQSLYLKGGVGFGVNLSGTIKDNMSVDLLKKQPFGLLAAYNIGLIQSSGKWESTLEVFNRFINSSYGQGGALHSLNLSMGYTIKENDFSKILLFAGPGYFYYNLSSEPIYVSVGDRPAPGAKDYFYIQATNRINSLKDTVALNINIGFRLYWDLARFDKIIITLMYTQGFVDFMFSDRFFMKSGYDTDYLIGTSKGSAVTLSVAYGLNLSKRIPSKRR